MLQVQMQTRMKSVCADTTSRYAMRGVEIRPAGEPDQVYASATDGRVLAVCKCQADGELSEPSIVPSEVLPNRQGGGRIFQNGDGRWEDQKSGRIGEPIAATFPPCADVVPDISPKSRYRVAIAVNVELLWNLARAIGRMGADASEPGNVVTLFIDKPNKPIGVWGGGERFGVIMPVNCEADSDRIAYERARVAYVATHNNGAMPMGEVVATVARAV